MVAGEEMSWLDGPEKVADLERRNVRAWGCESVRGTNWKMWTAILTSTLSFMHTENTT